MPIGEVQLVSRNRGFTDELAMEIIDREIRKCEKALRNLEIGTENYDNVFMELRMYQMHKDTLLIKKGGGRNDGQ